MDPEIHPRKAFIVQVVTVVHTCHSHNIAACRKRLETATRLFTTACTFDAFFDSLLKEAVAEIGQKLAHLRYVDQSDGAETTRIKSDCLVTVRRLHDVVKRMEIREGAVNAAPASDEDVRTTAFGWMRATG